MIIGLWHPGSGVGDQLFCYLAARITAERLGVPFGMVGEFKGKSFLHLEPGVNVPSSHHVELPAGKIVVDCDWPLYEGKRDFDPEFFFIKDNTIVDGCRSQDERYWKDYPIAEWLSTEVVDVPESLCIIGFRGGEYSHIPELFLTKDYWVDAMNRMRDEIPDIRFRIVTDDPDLARFLFPHIEVTHDIASDWKQVRHARYSIIANSAFYILPRWLRHHEAPYTPPFEPVTIAPRYWARRNIREWSTSQNYYPSFTYL